METLGPRRGRCATGCGYGRTRARPTRRPGRACCSPTPCAGARPRAAHWSSFVPRARRSSRWAHGSTQSGPTASWTRRRPSPDEPRVDAELRADVLAGDRIAEDYPVRRDLERADLRVVRARARLEDRHRAQQAGVGAQVLEQDDAPAPPAPPHPLPAPIPPPPPPAP